MRTAKSRAISAQVGRSGITSGRVAALYGSIGAGRPHSIDMGRRLFKACLAAIAAIAAMALTTLPAYAAPTNVRVSRVFQAPCAGPVCDSSQDTQLADNDVAKDTIQVQVTAASSAGLNYV